MEFENPLEEENDDSSADDHLQQGPFVKDSEGDAELRLGGTLKARPPVFPELEVIRSCLQLSRVWPLSAMPFLYVVWFYVTIVTAEYHDVHRPVVVHCHAMGMCALALGATFTTFRGLTSVAAPAGPIQQLSSATLITADSERALTRWRDVFMFCGIPTTTLAAFYFVYVLDLLALPYGTALLFVNLLVVIWGCFLIANYLTQLVWCAAMVAECVEELHAKIGRTNEERSATAEMSDVEWEENIRGPAIVLAQETMPALSVWSNSISSSWSMAWASSLLNLPLAAATMNPVIIGVVGVTAVVPLGIVLAPANVSSSCDSLLKDRTSFGLLEVRPTPSE